MMKSKRDYKLKRIEKTKVIYRLCFSVLVSYKCNIATEKAVAFLVTILYLVGGLGETYPHTSCKGAGMIYIQSFFLHRRAGEEPTPPEERPPTQLTKVWRGRTDSPGGADR